jgi:uncharacterized membrane protein
MLPLKAFLKWTKSPVFWAVLLALIFAVVILFITIQMYSSYNTGAPFDLGAFTQNLKYTLHGKFLYSPAIGGSQLTLHFSPVLLLLVPVYWVFPHAQMLIVAQCLLLAFSGFLVYLLAREYKFSPRAGLILEWLFFINPLVWGVALYDFHESAFAIPALLVMFLGLKKKNWLLFGLGLFIALISKEDVVITLGVFGFVLMLSDYWQHRKIEKISLIIFCSAILTYGIGVIVSRLASGGIHEQMLSYLSIRYAYIGQPLSTAVPLFLHTVFSINSLFLIGAYLAPLAFLPLFSPKWCIPALAVLLEGILSTNFGQHGMLMQYPAAALPFLFAAFMVVLPKVQENQQIQSIVKKTKNRAFTYSLIFMAVIAFSIILEGNIQSFALPDAHAAAINQVIALVPNNASVTTPINIFPHICSRTDAYIDAGEGDSIAPSAGIVNGDWGFPDKNTEYVVIDTNHGLVKVSNLSNLIKQYTLIKNIDGVLLYKFKL